MATKPFQYGTSTYDKLEVGSLIELWPLAYYTAVIHWPPNWTVEQLASPSTLCVFRVKSLKAPKQYKKKYVKSNIHL